MHSVALACVLLLQVANEATKAPVRQPSSAQVESWISPARLKTESCLDLINWTQTVCQAHHRWNPSRATAQNSYCAATLTKLEEGGSLKCSIQKHEVKIENRNFKRIEVIDQGIGFSAL